jgi:large subunit ribosomal protein L15
MTLSLHSLKPVKSSHHRRKRLGRGLGSGHGAYSTRGVKGQRARQGGRKGLVQFGVKHFVTRLPKVRGFRSFKLRPQVINVAELNIFENNTQVTPQLLAKKGLIVNSKGMVKLIGGSKIKPELTVMVHSISAGAKVAIEKAGGKVELIKKDKN